jgi:hypothetical protein
MGQGVVGRAAQAEVFQAVDNFSGVVFVDSGQQQALSWRET